MTLDGRDPASRTPDPGAVVEERQAVAAITKALEQLPPSLREPLAASMQGYPLREIAEDLGYSESTARRRIAEARHQLSNELAASTDQGRWEDFDKGTDPVLEGAQGEFEQTVTSSLAPPPVSGRAR